MRNALSYILTGLLLALALLPVFPGVLRGEMLVPGAHLYRFPPWSAYRPEDLPEQNPITAEVPMQVCVWYAVTDMAFARGEWPLWNPLQFTGAPLLANLQSAIFYPPRLLFRVVNDMPLSMTLFILMRFWLCGFNAFVAARLLGIRVGPARFFSLAYMLAGYNLSWAFYPPPDVMAWFPYLFVAAEWLLNRRYRRGFLAMTPSVLIMLLAGGPSHFVACCLGLYLYALARLILQRGGVKHTLLCAGIASSAFALAVACGAIQIVPFLEYLPASTPYIDRLQTGGVTYYKYTFVDLYSLFAPRFLGTELEGTMWGSINHTYLAMLYVGVSVWVAVLLLLGRLPFTPQERFRVRCLLGVSALCLYLSAGLPGAGLLFRLPVLGQVRPAYAIAFGALAVPFAAAYALQAWLREQAPAKRLVRPALATVALAATLAVLLLLVQSLSPQYITARADIPGLPAYILRQAGLALGIAAMTLLSMFAFTFRPKCKYLVLPVLCAILVADQAHGIRGLIPTTPRAYLFPRTEVTDFLRAQDHPCRVRFDRTWMHVGYGAIYDIEELHAYDAIYPLRFKPLLDTLDTMPGSPVDNLLACEYVLFCQADGVPDGYVSVLETEGISLGRNAHSVPRARLMGRVERFASTEAMFAAMNAPEFDPAAAVYVDVPMDADVPEANAAAGTARITDWQWQSVTVEADASAPCVLVLSDLFYPGWEAVIDGGPATIFPAYHFFRGVIVPEGRHTIVFQYRPRSFAIGAAISVVALVLMLLVAVTMLIHGGRRARRTTP